MRRRITALLLALVMLLALGASAASAEDEPSAEKSVSETDIPEASALADVPAEESTEEAAEPEARADAAGTLSFANLGSRMRENYFPLLGLEESVQMLEEIDYDRMELDLRDGLNQIASQQWMMVNYGMYGSKEYEQLQQAYDSMRKQFDAIREGEMQEDNADALHQLRSAENQMIVFGETMFITLKGLETQDAALSRTVARLDRTVREMNLRQELGQISALTADQIRLGRAQAESGQKTLEMNMDTLLLQLKSMVGAELGEPLKLGTLPRVTAAELAAMELEADLDKAKAASYELLDAKKTYDEAKKEYSSHGYIDPERASYEQMQYLHTWRTAQYTYENTVQTFELNFRALYAQVKDCAQVLDAARAALETQEKSYAASALRYEQGSISANALADAADELADAKDGVTNAERELLLQYRSYWWAVEYGILNG